MKRSKFSLSHYKLLSMDMGELVPIACVEVLPGDTLQHTTSALVRASPLLAPVMHPVHCHIRHFFVPFRLLWPAWEDFITGGPDGMDATAVPQIAAGVARPATCAEGSLGDYLGLPPITTTTHSVSAFPFRAYAMIYNEYYRDQDLQAELPMSTGNGVDSTTNITLQRVNWEKDYFTSARPWEQKGPAVNVPINSNGQNIQLRSSNTPTVDQLFRHGAAGTDAATFIGGASPGSAGNLRFGTQSGLQVSIDLLREAFALQRYEEARARFGSRYVEYLRYLGVRSSDARLQRPEYLGGGVQTLQFSEVLQTAEGTDPVGDLKGHGIAAMRSNRYRRFFEEHGLVLSLMSVRPKSLYMQGIQRLWSKGTKEMYWQKELQFIGQQEVRNMEVDVDIVNGGGTFGYQDRYDEYRRIPSTVSGEFRGSKLNYWHFGRNFSGGAALNSAFVTCNPTERTFAVPSQDVLYVMAHHSIQARRLVAKSGSHSFVF
nr:MAG: major capsid protein [Microvirus sp.]